MIQPNHDLILYQHSVRLEEHTQHKYLGTITK